MAGENGGGGGGAGGGGAGEDGAGGDGVGGAGDGRARWAAVTVDCVDPRRVADFWGRLLGTPTRPVDGLPGWLRLGPTVAGGPVITFQPVPEEKAGKTRIHLDLWVDDLDAAMGTVAALGGRHSGETHRYDEGTVAVMADAEGNEFCLVGPPGSG